MKKILLGGCGQTDPAAAAGSLSQEQRHYFFSSPNKFTITLTHNLSSSLHSLLPLCPHLHFNLASSAPSIYPPNLHLMLKPSPITPSIFQLWKIFYQKFVSSLSPKPIHYPILSSTVY